jgi:hypothetical protein
VTGESDRAPRTYLVWSAVATILCFLPLGLVALIFGFGAQRALEAGDRELASRRGRVARRWLVAAVAVGLLLDAILSASLIALGAFSH